MRRRIVGLAAIVTVALAGPALAGSAQDEVQQEEAPGSQIEIDIGRGQGIEPPSVELGVENLDVPNDPTTLDAGDPEDDALPGEGPENLSGPDDDDSLPE